MFYNLNLNPTSSENTFDEPKDILDKVTYQIYL